MKLDKIIEKIDKIIENQAVTNVYVEQNTKDLSEHIRRTNILEGKMQKIIYLLILGAGIGMALYGPEALKLIGIIL